MGEKRDETKAATVRAWQPHREDVSDVC